MEPLSTLRLIEEKKADIAIKDYQRSFRVVQEVKDTTAQEVLASCDVIGNALFTGLQFSDSNSGIKAMKPNRKVMPSAWRFLDSQGNAVYEIKRVALFRLFNPFSRCFFYLNDIAHQRQYVLEDRISNLGDLWFGSSSREWSITEQGQVVATIRRQLEEENQPALKKTRSWFSGLKKLFRSSYWVLQLSQDQYLPAPVFIGLMVILHEHTQNVAA